MNSLADRPQTKIKQAFENSPVLLALDKIVPLKVLRPGVKASKKYVQIVNSVRAIGLVEPPVVTPDRRHRGSYLLLDGHLRLEALNDLSIHEVECLISTDDEAYTFNKHVNRLAAIQEHRMITRAMERGVSEERIAEALGLDPISIRRRFRLLDGICPEAVNLLSDKPCPIKLFDLLREMAPIRQVEAAELMIGQGNYSTLFARALLAATPESQLVGKKKNPNQTRAMTAEQIARMERELASLQTQVKSVEDSYSVDNLHLTIAKGYIGKLLTNARLVNWFSQHRPEYLTEFQAIAEIDTIAAAANAPSSKGSRNRTSARR